MDSDKCGKNFNKNSKPSSEKQKTKGLKQLLNTNLRSNQKLFGNSILHNTRYGQRENGLCHSFLTDVTHVIQMEQSLLQLLKDFHSGKLQAFGQDITFQKMENVREQQERLAKLHFELNSKQHESNNHDSEEGRRVAKEKIFKLIDNLQQLSNSIEQLQSNNVNVSKSNQVENNQL